MGKNRKLAKEILKKLKFEKAPLNYNPGRRIHDPIAKRLTRKDRRHSGHKIVYLDDEGYVTQFDSYDDWRNYCDGARDKSKIKKNIYPQMNWRDEEDYWDLRNKRDKLRKHEKIRKEKKKRKGILV